jgi:crossover junction endodeoxyribonuclease RuvC
MAVTLLRTLGIDPGSRHTGYGVIQSDGRDLQHIAHGTIQIPLPMAHPQRLGVIYQQLMAMIEQYRPDSMATEDVFFAKNVKSALRLGQARGAALLAGVNAGLTVCEYSALEIKQAVVGYGRASKEQVSEMIRCLLLVKTPLDAHAADALAVALCHLNMEASKQRWRRYNPS